jgi:hypothetical protein
MGMQVGLATFTMRHTKRDRLAALWDALSYSWHRTTGGKGWVVDVERSGLVGVLRVVEVTIGKNGWHVHVHALLFGREMTDASLDVLCESMWGRWSSALQRKGLRAPLMRASEWHLVTGDLSGTKLGEYLSKGVDAAASIGMELTQTQSKIAQGVHKTRPVMSLLEDGAIDAEVRPLRLWHEWEQASSGRRQIAWSKDLRALLQLGLVEKSDEEIAAEELGSAADTIVVITSDGWSKLRGQPKLIPDVLNAAELGGAALLSAFLCSHEIEHWRER